jgi:transcription antitermination factor NusG
MGRFHRAQAAAAGPAIVDPPVDVPPSGSVEAATPVADEESEVQPRDPLVLAEGDEGWTVLYTRARREKRVARACCYLGVNHYLPLREHRTRTHRRRLYLLPLFPSYVFACLSPERRIELLETGAIVKVIRVDHPAVLLDELRQIRAALEKGADLTLGPTFKRGERVRVVHGEFAGLEGVVKDFWRRRRRLRLVLNVSALSQSASLHVDVADVERVRTCSASTTVAVDGCDIARR